MFILFFRRRAKTKKIEFSKNVKKEVKKFIRHFCKVFYPWYFFKIRYTQKPRQKKKSRSNRNLNKPYIIKIYLFAQN